MPADAAVGRNSLRIGDVVRVRSRQFLVEQVVPPDEGTSGTLVRLSCLDDDAQGMPLEVLWELEVDAERITGDTWERVAERGFDPPRMFSAYFHTLRWNCVTATDPKLFQSPFRAGIQVLEYQLEPLRKALLLPRVNLFIADDVGLGKTIEAGLIVRELLMRQKIRRIVVACPKSVVRQWQDELDQRFGLPFVVYDRDFVQACRRERGYGVNPWTTHSRFIISQSLLSDEAYVTPLRDWLGELAMGSLFILDEAHHAAPAGSEVYAIDSQFTQAIRELAPRFEHRLFLSATPHNGHSNSFAALMEILDPQRFCRGVPVRSEKVRDQVMVRRLKSDLREIVAGIPERKVEQITIAGLPDDAPELVLPALLENYKSLREHRLSDRSKTAQASAALVVTNLQKRLLSSIEAFAFTLRVHRRALERQAEAAGAAPLTGAAAQSLLHAPGCDDDRADLDEGEVQAEEEALIERASRVPGPGGHSVTPAELSLLREMEEKAQEHRARPDPRVRELVAWIRAHCCPGLPTYEDPVRTGAPWNNRRVIIFTEYVDTKRYLVEQLSALVALTDRGDERIATYHGGMNEAARESIKKAFNRAPSQDPLRILIATDAAREGINLQNHCADLFHFDVPWNPTRLEQRNGRIDRKLQRAPVVHCRYFVFAQRPEDAVLEALVDKTRRILGELGSLPPVIENRLERLLRKGIERERSGELAQAIAGLDASHSQETVDAELEAVRARREEMRKKLDDLARLREQSRKALAMDERQLRDALSLSLELAGAEPLTEARTADGEPCWTVPALDRQPGADRSWADLLDPLREERRPDQPLKEWRLTARVMPVVFADRGTVEPEEVHLHLEHRLVRRLLGLFSAQGFVHHDLSRACVTQSRDRRRRVAVIGRLSVFGRAAARLHEEMLVVTAEWVDPRERTAPLKPYAEDAEKRTMGLVEQALQDVDGHAVSPTVIQRLRAHVQQDLAELIPHLNARAGEALELARRQLAERAEREAREIISILENQRVQIEKAQKRNREQDLDQKRLFEADEEHRARVRRQIEAERVSADRRLAQLPLELEEEPQRIRETYAVKAHRVEPVGVVYLWPAE